MSTRKAKEPRPRKGAQKAKTKPTGRKKSGNGAATAQPKRRGVDAGQAAYMAGDFKRAREIWLPLAEAGNVEAQAWVGSLYANGDGVDVDDQTAFGWYLKSAEGGNVQAQSNVGAMCAMGKGVSENAEEAARWFQRAAEGGDAHGQFNLAVLYTTGKGVAKDMEKAADWYRQAAEGGHYPSQARLGYMYAHGQGVAKDRVQAFLWLSLAAQHGIGTALDALDGVVKKMSSEEKAEGLRLFDEWRSRTLAKAGPGRIEPLPG